MKEKIFLPGLNGLRAIAALSVILCHVFQELKIYGLEGSGRFNSFGIYGVTIFFTLSGFLITYLLLKEKEKTNTVDINKFYVRRVLRIWPLYFLFLTIVLFVIDFQFSSNIWYYLLMLPNIPWAVGSAGGAIHTIPLLSHYWSLGVEEQFYAFWPFVIKKISKLKWFLIAFCLLFVGLKFALKLSHAPATIISFVYYTRFSCLIIGGLGAYLYYNKSKLVSFCSNVFVECATWILLIVLLCDFVTLYSILGNEIVSILTLIIIFNQIQNPKKIFSLENKVFDYLGKISFGLYIYNPLIIHSLASLFNNQLQNQYYIKIALILILNFSLAIIIAHISYHYFEKRFLKIKHKFTTIESFSSNPNN